jgi:hypothetical protein
MNAQAHPIFQPLLDAIAPRASDMPVGARYIDVDLKHFSLYVIYTVEGSTHPATETSPAEAPVPNIFSCRLRCGDWTTLVPFHQLAEAVRERVFDEIAEEIGQ